jgi:hypothetical protein
MSVNQKAIVSTERLEGNVRTLRGESVHALQDELEFLTTLYVKGADSREEALDLLTEAGEVAVTMGAGLAGYSPAVQVLAACVLLQATLERSARLVQEAGDADCLYVVPEVG